MRNLLIVLLWLLLVAAFGYGGLIMGNAKSAVHEIEAEILFLTGTVALVGIVLAMREK